MVANPREKRRAPRFPVYFTTEYESEERRGSGITKTLSRVGAWVGETTQPVPVGERLRIRVSAFVGSFATPLAARVVGVASDGFAVEFGDLGPAEHEILSRALSAA